MQCYVQLPRWGSRLCVSSKEARLQQFCHMTWAQPCCQAEVLCQQVWQVPAEERTINFEDFEGKGLPKKGELFLTRKDAQVGKLCAAASQTAMWCVCSVGRHGKHCAALFRLAALALGSPSVRRCRRAPGQQSRSMGLLGFARCQQARGHPELGGAAAPVVDASHQGHPQCLGKSQAK